MLVNNTCVHGNETSTCLASGSSAGLAAGLTVLFLLLAITAGVIIYKWQSTIRNRFKLGRGRSQKTEGCAETPGVDLHQYTVMSRQQSRGQTPIYENLTAKTAQNNRTNMKQCRASGESEEGLYLQCDAIYSNHPSHNPPIPSPSQEEDVYIVPDL